MQTNIFARNVDSKFAAQQSALADNRLFAEQLITQLRSVFELYQERGKEQKEERYELSKNRSVSSSCTVTATTAGVTFDWGGYGAMSGRTYSASDAVKVLEASALPDVVAKIENVYSDKKAKITLTADDANLDAKAALIVAVFIAQGFCGAVK